MPLPPLHPSDWSDLLEALAKAMELIALALKLFGRHSSALSRPSSYSRPRNRP